MMDEDVDGTLVRMFQAFMQAAPQMILQFFIMSHLQLDAGAIVGKLKNSDFLDFSYNPAYFFSQCTVRINCLLADLGGCRNGELPPLDAPVSTRQSLVDATGHACHVLLAHAHHRS